MKIDIMDLTMAIMGMGLGFLFISCGIWILSTII